MGAPILSFEAGKGVSVDLDQLVSSRLLIQANSGGGKSRMLRYLLEQTHGRIQQIVLDPEGEFSSLREKFDYLLAGRDGDVPADPKTAKVLVRRIMELGASAVIDLYDLRLDQRRQFVRVFLEELMHLPRALWRPMLIPIDEAHVFAPEQGQSEALQAVITLCTQGRKRGYSPILATQRLSKLHKDAAAELLNKLIGRTGLDVDMKRAGDELGFDKDRRLTLRDLEPGDFYAFGPAIARSVTLVRSGAITTTHPQPGKIAPPAPPAPAAIKKLVSQMQDLAKRAEEEARTEAELRDQIAKKERRIRELEHGAPKEIDAAVIDAQIHHGINRARREWEREAANNEKELRSIVTAHERKFAKAAGIAEQLVAVLKNGHAAAMPPVKPVSRPGPMIPPRAPGAPARTVAPVTRTRAPSDPGSLPKGEHATLTAACQYPDGVTRQQLTILTGYKRSSRDAYVQRLREKGLVEVRGELVIAAEGAEEHLGSFEPLPTGDELREYWLNRLPTGEAAVLQALVDAYPEGLTREAIDEVTGYKRSSRDAYIQRLGARQVIEINGGEIRAAEFLFDASVR